jgi:hypothetical protein
MKKKKRLFAHRIHGKRRGDKKILPHCEPFFKHRSHKLSHQYLCSHQFVTEKNHSLCEISDSAINLRHLHITNTMIHIWVHQVPRGLVSHSFYYKYHYHQVKIQSLVQFCQEVQISYTWTIKINIIISFILMEYIFLSILFNFYIVSQSSW